MSPQATTVNEVIKQLNEDMSKLESQLEVITERSHTIYRKTTVIIRTVFYTIGALTLLNFYFIFDFGKNILSMISSMEAMYTHFGNVTEQVDLITKDVVSMSNNVQLMPQISDKMTSMNTTVRKMDGDIASMQESVNGMKTDVLSINQNMSEMSQRFVNVNHSMDNMVGNVNQMAKPIP